MRPISLAPRSLSLWAIFAPALLLLGQNGGCTPDPQSVNEGCVEDADCDNGEFCDGQELCNQDGVCGRGLNPCEDGEFCNEDEDRCVRCVDVDCDDGEFCNGVETCGPQGACTDGLPPCDEATLCDEAADRCGECSRPEDCADGDPCTQEFCEASACIILPQCEFPFTCDPQDGTCDLFGDPCLSQCELGVGFNCAERPLDEFDDFDAALAAWRADPACGANGFPARVVGECADGTRLLHESTGFTLQTNFYDADTGAFVALTTQTDVIDPICHGVGYWPLHFEYGDATVTEVVCGDVFGVGDSIVVP